MKKYALFTSILISTLPLLFLSYFFFNEIRALTQDQILISVQRELDIGAQNLNDFLLERKGNLKEWAQSPAVQVALEFNRPEGLTKNLKKLKNSYPSYDWITVFNSNLLKFSSSDVSKLESELSPRILSKHSVYMDSFSKLYLSEKILNLQTGIYAGQLIGKISSNKIFSYQQQVQEHLKRFNLKSLKFGINPRIQNRLNELQLCSKIPTIQSSICIILSKDELGLRFYRLKLVIIFTTLILIVFTFLLINFVFKRIMSPSGAVLDSLTLLAKGKFEKINLKSSLKELKQLEFQYNSLVDNIEKYNQDLKIHSRNHALYEISVQVAHDIRSPLAALEMATEDLGDASEEEKTIIKSAIDRINSIANDLISVNALIASNSESEVSVYDLDLILTSLINEKRLQFSNMPSVTFNYVSIGSQLVVTNLDRGLLARIISNLINNSVEAFKDIGAVDLTLNLDASSANVIIGDNGIGIPTESIEKVFNKGYSASSKKHGSGSGLGLFYAKHELEKRGGSIKITSLSGSGTQVELKFKLKSLESIFVNELLLDPASHIIVIDDEVSIHEMWKIRINEFDIAVSCFLNCEDFLDWQNTQEKLEPNFLYLVDADLGKGRINGLEFIHKMDAYSSSILVTSQHDSDEIVEQCLKMNVSLLPKRLISKLPIKVLG